MIRPSFESIFMNFAKEIAKRSHDPKMKVGTVITSPDFYYVYAIGINGGAKGLSNERDSLESGKSGFLHSECNAAINCTVPRNYDKVVFCTHEPCSNCSKILINLGGVKNLYYEVEYKNGSGIYLLKEAGIECIHLERK
jgi:dCMP deaminase